MADSREEGEWPHHQILRVHRQYAFRQHLRIQEAVPYLTKRKAIPRSLCKEITKLPENNDDNINFLLAYLREAKVERFVRFIEALGDSVSSPAEQEPVKSHVTLLDTMSEALEKISNADIEQVRRVRAVVKSIRPSPTSMAEIGRETTSDAQAGSEALAPSVEDTGFTKPHRFEATKTEPVVYQKEMELPTERTVSCLPSEQIAVAERESEELRLEENVYKAVTVEPKLKYQRGFIEPRISKCFQRDGLNEHWTSWLLSDCTHGITVDIPVDAVPPEVLHFAVVVHAYLSGNFKIPDEYEACTAMFTLKTDPNFEFVKAVSVKLPHSLIFDGDEDEEDLVVLHAQDPEQTSVYQFNDILSSADYSEDYYVQVQLDHFSAIVGAKRRMRHRLPKRTHPWVNSTLRRQSSSTRQRSRSRRRPRRGDSVGSSRQSSYESSFERDLPPQLNLPRQGSSTESDGPVSGSLLLQRQAAIQGDDTPISLLHQASSNSVSDEASCNEIHVTCCSPLRCITSWTSRFFVVPNYPTARKALQDARNSLERKFQVEMDSVGRNVLPNNRYIEFKPDIWEDDHWIVTARSTPVITCDSVSGNMLNDEPVPHVDFEVESKNKKCCSPLRHKITVTGVEIAGKEVFFTIGSTNNSAKKRRVTTPSWLYSEDSILVELLPQVSEENNIALNPGHKSDSVVPENFKLDVCKLMAEVALQTPTELYDQMFEEMHICENEQWKLFEIRDNPEQVYQAFFFWINKKRPNLLELKCLLQAIGFDDIVLTTSDVPTLLSNYPQLNNLPCERYICTGLADKLHARWGFVGRYLGLDDSCFSDLSNIADIEGDTEAAFKMLDKWRQQFSREATVGSLVKAVCRTNDLSLCCIQSAVCYLENVFEEKLMFP